MTVKVSKIILEIGKKTLEFTPQEVAELQAELNKLYPPPERIIYVDKYPTWLWSKPFWTPTEPTPLSYPQISYQQNSNGLNIGL